MAKRNYTFYSDPAHGWLKVSFKELVALGIQDKISACSYMRWNGTSWDIYLEEDCDAPRFFEAKEARGEEITVKHQTSSKSSKIRSYYSYNTRYTF